jgi:hypothetical protein
MTMSWNRYKDINSIETEKNIKEGAQGRISVDGDGVDWETG